MKPILYSWNEWAAGHRDANGRGILSDAISCTVTEEINGDFDLAMQYHIKGLHGSEIKERDVILAKPNPTQRAQPFRIYRITRPINGVFNIYAHHISYDLDDIPVNPFKALSIPGAAAELKAKSVIANPFEIAAPTEDFKSGVLELTEPATARSILLGDENSIASTFFTPVQGQCYFDWYDVQLFERRGADRGARIEYGVNMTKFNKDSNRSEFYNGIYPYAKNADGTLLFLPEKILRVSGFTFDKIAIVDLSQRLKDQELNTDNLRTAARSYMSENDFGKYIVSLDVSFVNLKDTAEYARLESLVTISLGDTVEVVFPEYGESTKEICSKTVFNVLTEKYNSVTIGKLRRGI